MRSFKLGALSAHWEMRGDLRLGGFEWSSLYFLGPVLCFGASLWIVLPGLRALAFRAGERNRSGSRLCGSSSWFNGPVFRAYVV